MKLNTKALADVEIGIPLIAEGVYHARIVKEKLQVKPNKRGDGNNLVVQYKILDNPVYLHKDGKEIENKGQVVSTRHYSLVQTADYDPDQNMKELAVAIKNPPDKDLEVEDLGDKLVMVKIIVKPARKGDDGKDYPEGNEVQRVTPVKDDDTFTTPF
jgi:hypothetical protein